MNKIKLIGVICGVCFMQPHVLSAMTIQEIKALYRQGGGYPAIINAIKTGKASLQNVNKYFATQGKSLEWSHIWATETQTGKGSVPPPFDMPPPEKGTPAPEEGPKKTPPPPPAAPPPPAPEKGPKKTPPPTKDEIIRLAKEAGTLIGKIDTKLKASPLDRDTKTIIAQSIVNPAMDMKAYY